MSQPVTVSDRPWRTITRYFTKQCRYCVSTNIYALFERGTSNRVSEYRCCDCNQLWEKPRKWVYHPESECAFEVHTSDELLEAFMQGCEECSEYYATMVDLGLWDEIDHEYERELRTENNWQPNYKM